MKRISALVGVLAILALAVPTIATASSTCQGYGSQTCSSVSNGTVSTSSGNSSASNASSAGPLPFTGLDVALLVAGGGTLLAAGFVIRRLSRRLD